MFLENISGNQKKRGWIEVICGSMFSGKTEELIRRLKRAALAKQKIEIFKPKVDIRYDGEKIVSHDSKKIKSTPVKNALQILKHAKDIDVVGIDEVQFFDEKIVEVCNTLANKGTRVIVAGLDMDYRGEPFGSIPQLMSVAEYVTKVHAICMECGGLANHSYRLSKDKTLMILGEKSHYEALCRTCFNDRWK